MTPEEARAIVAQLDWSTHVPGTDKADESRLISTLLEHLTRPQTGGTATVELTISDLVFAAAGRSDAEISEKAAETHLKRRGFRLDEGKQHLLVSNQHSEIARILEKTPWAGGWSRVLKRLPGAQSTSDPVRFGPEAKQRAVQVPLACIFGD